jgi:divalent metal cation (Fe/Co/Zn/Cd) transporter
MSEATTLPTVAVAPATDQEVNADWLHAARRARLLSWISLVWMGAEGAIGITAGILAGSIALIGFGLDSAIEGFASLVIVWRFTGARLHSHAAEERAQKLVAVQFFLLAPYVAIEAVRDLATGVHPEVSLLGMALTATSLVGMPYLGLAKQRLAQQLGSSATHGEGAQNLICAYLAGAVFLGLAANALFGWWWLDSIAALAIAAVAVREGVETWRGEGCCASPVGFGSADGCEDDCCAEDAPRTPRAEEVLAETKR